MATKKEAAGTAAESPVKNFRALVEHVEEAERPETRPRRIERSVAQLAEGRKEPR